MKRFKVSSLVFCCFLVLFSFSGCSLSSIGIGLSAYEVAVKNGFTGTEEEWLNSLQGDYSAWENKISALENKIEQMVNELEDDEISVQYATNLAMRSSVKVLAGASTGSGTIIAYDEVSKKAHILTCYHVILDSNNTNTYVNSSIQIQFYGLESSSMKYNAKFLGGNPYADVAFLEVVLTDDVWNKYSLSVSKINTSRVQNGKTCIAIGNTKNKGLNAVKGNISLASQLTSITNLTNLAGTSTLRVMRVNAILAHGNSGGGLFNTKGELIGMINSKSSNEEELNFSYAIPANVAYGIYVNILNQISQNGGAIGVLAKKCQIGLSLTVNDVSAEYDQTNMDYYYVQEVGVKASSISQINANDVIYEATLKRGEEEVKTIKIIEVYDLGELMWLAKVGDTLTLKYKREYTVEYVSIGITSVVTNLYSTRDKLDYA